MQFSKTIIAFTVITGMLVSPSLATADDQTFGGVHYLAAVGKRAKQVKARLVLTDSSVEVYEQKGQTALKQIPYQDIKAAT